MNIRSLCFARVSRDRNEPWLWWEFVDRLGEDCRMKDKLYTAECAQKVRRFRGLAWGDGSKTLGMLETAPGGVEPMHSRPQAA